MNEKNESTQSSGSSQSAMAANPNCHQRSTNTWDIAESYESCLNGGTPPKDYLYGLLNLGTGYTCIGPIEINYSEIGTYGITDTELVNAGYKRADGDRILIFPTTRANPSTNQLDVKTSLYSDGSGKYVMLCLLYTIGTSKATQKKNKIRRTTGVSTL